MTDDLASRIESLVDQMTWDLAVAIHNDMIEAQPALLDAGFKPITPDPESPWA